MLSSISSPAPSINPNSAKSILTEFEDDRRQILFKFDSANLPELILSQLNIDSTCLYQMGRNRGNKYKCRSCASLEKLCPLEAVDNWSSPQMLEIESEKKLLHISATPNCSYGLEYDPSAAARALSISKMDELSECSVCLDNQNEVENYLAADSWMNDVLLNWITDTILRGKSIPSTSRYNKVFICSGVGYTVRDTKLLPVSSLSSSVNLNLEVIVSIILQIIVIFDCLAEYNFSGGGLIWSDFRYVDSPCNFSYKDLSISSPITLKLGNLSSASINYKKVRVFPSNLDIKSDNILNIESVIDKLNYGIIDVYSKKFKPRDLLYRIPMPDEFFFRSLVYSGYPLLAGSYDFYLILSSLLATSSIYDQISTQAKVKIFWTSLFPGKPNIPELPICDSVNFKSTVQCLTDIYLYCSVMEKAMEAAPKLQL